MPLRSLFSKLKPGQNSSKDAATCWLDLSMGKEWARVTAELSVANKNKSLAEFLLSGNEKTAYWPSKKVFDKLRHQLEASPDFGKVECATSFDLESFTCTNDHKVDVSAGGRIDMSWESNINLTPKLQSFNQDLLAALRSETFKHYYPCTEEGCTAHAKSAKIRRIMEMGTINVEGSVPHSYRSISTFTDKEGAVHFFSSKPAMLSVPGDFNSPPLVVTRSS